MVKDIMKEWKVYHYLIMKINHFCSLYAVVFTYSFILREWFVANVIVKGF